MTRLNLLAMLAATALLAACEARIGKEDSKPQAGGGETRTAANGKARAGEFSIDTPGFQMKIDIPESVAERADVESDKGILYPGAKLSGMHIEARERAEGGRSIVELRFTSADSPGKIAAWYRDPARAGEFSVASASESGGVISIAGTEKEDGDPFDLSLRPRSGGGTDGLLRLRDRS